MRKVWMGCMVMVLLMAAAGCGTKVIRTDERAVTDYSGSWNDTDARMVAEEMISDCLTGHWINDFNKMYGRTPQVIVGTIANKTYEHIAADVFIQSLERTLTNSGKVQFVESKGERQEVRDERQDQLAGNTDPATISHAGHEIGADFMLQGSINAIQDAVRGKMSMFYQVNLQLVDMKTNQKIWIGQKEIKKIILRPSTGF